MATGYTDGLVAPKGILGYSTQHIKVKPMMPTAHASIHLSSCVGKVVHVAYERRWSNASLSATHLLAKERDILQSALAIVYWNAGFSELTH